MLTKRYTLTKLLDICTYIFAHIYMHIYIYAYYILIRNNQGYGWTKTLHLWNIQYRKTLKLFRLNET